MNYIKINDEDFKNLRIQIKDVTEGEEELNRAIHVAYNCGINPYNAIEVWKQLSPLGAVTVRILKPIVEICNILGKLEMSENSQ